MKGALSGTAMALIIGLISALIALILIWSFHEKITKFFSEVLMPGITKFICNILGPLKLIVKAWGFVTGTETC